MIVVDSVTKNFGPIRALSALSFTVPSGSVCGFLGPNGAGKTTMLRILAGAIESDSGAHSMVDHSGVDHSGVDHSGVGNSAGGGWGRASGSVPRGAIGYLPEGAPLPADMTVEEHLLMRCRLYGVPRGERCEAIEQAITACELREVRRRLVANLSRGFRQRAGLASVLVHRPRFLLLDEPSSGLDPGQAEQFRSTLRGLRGRCTVLLCTHNLDEVESVCDRAVFVRAGKLIAQGGLDQLREAGASLLHLVIESSSIDVASLGRIEGARHVASESLPDGWIRTRVDVGAQSAGLEQRVGELLRLQNVTVRRMEIHRAPLTELFSSLMKGDG